MSEQPQVLVLTARNDAQLSMLKNIPHVVENDMSAFERAKADAAVILHWSGDRELLRTAFLASPKVRWVHSRAAGLDHILFPELVDSDIPLTNGRGVFSQTLGEFALAAILYFAKDFPRMLRNKAAERWEQFDVEEIAGQTVGIVGYGDIGRAVARRCHAMEMRVLALKRHAPEGGDPLVERFLGPEELADLLGRSDYVVVAAPLTAETLHLISDEEFAAMKPGGVILNLGRGPVIDQAAMVRALSAKRIKGAGLDVFEQEPIPPGDPLWKLENVFISPHCADNTRDWLNDAMRFFIEQYGRFNSSEELENIVDKRLGY